MPTRAAIDRVARPPRPLRRPAGPAPGELPRARRGRARPPASARSTARCSTSACRRSSSPTASAASGSGPAARSTCASTPSRGVPASELLATPRRRRARRAVPPVRRGAAGLADRQGDRRGPRRPRPIADGRGSGRARRARRRPANPRQRRRIHPATRVFQALRIAVNEELDALEDGPAPPPSTCCGPAAASSSCPTTRSRTGSSSGSSRRAARLRLPARGARSASAASSPRLRLVTRPSLTPTDDEIDANPRARSARLRAAERLAA